MDGVTGKHGSSAKHKTAHKARVKKNARQVAAVGLIWEQRVLIVLTMNHIK